MLLKEPLRGLFSCVGFNRSLIASEPNETSVLAERPFAVVQGRALHHSYRRRTFPFSLTPRTTCSNES
jgi:hypothetical protein